MKMFAIATVALAVACGSSTGGDGADSGTGSLDAAQSGDAIERPDAIPPVPIFAELWYSADDALVRIELDVDDGSVVAFTASAINGDLALGQNLITMLDDGSIVGGRLSKADGKTYFYHIPDPPRDGSAVTPVALGIMPDSLKLEGLYTDCDGRLYGMDTGVDDGSAAGNRLLRFTGDFLAGDFSYVVVSDLASATVADIDDMGPAIVANEIVDNPGMAIDSGQVYSFNFETGTGTMVGSGGTWGIHALGKELFSDSKARLYVFSSSAELFEMSPTTYSLSSVLGTGPATTAGAAGWSGLAGPLTDCDSGFTVE